MSDDIASAFRLFTQGRPGPFVDWLAAYGWHALPTEYAEAAIAQLRTMRMPSNPGKEADKLLQARDFVKQNETPGKSNYPIMEFAAQKFHVELHDLVQAYSGKRPDVNKLRKQRGDTLGRVKKREAVSF